MNLVPHEKQWKQLYEEEASLIKDSIGYLGIIDIQHIGSTAIPNIMAKPIIDIAVKIPSLEEIKSLIKPQIIEPLNKLGYDYDEKRSSSERFFFTKGKPSQFHLSITDTLVSYWRRQILFRDYLINHSSLAKEYEQLKIALLEKESKTSEDYSKGKTIFIQKILTLAENEGAQ